MFSILLNTGKYITYTVLFLDLFNLLLNYFKITTDSFLFSLSTLFDHFPSHYMFFKDPNGMDNFPFNSLLIESLWGP